MENLYDVGIANRFALFLDEGDSSLTAIRKKISKETRIKDKQNKKENAEVKKVETAKTPEKVKKPVENKPVTNDVTPPKKGMVFNFIAIDVLGMWIFFEIFSLVCKGKIGEN